MTLSDLGWLSEIFNDTKRRASATAELLVLIVMHDNKRGAFSIHRVCDMQCHVASVRHSSFLFDVASDIIHSAAWFRYKRRTSRIVCRKFRLANTAINHTHLGTQTTTLIASQISFSPARAVAHPLFLVGHLCSQGNGVSAWRHRDEYNLSRTTVGRWQMIFTFAKEVTWPALFVCDSVSMMTEKVMSRFNWNSVLLLGLPCERTA